MTEKNYNPKQKEMKSMGKQKTAVKMKTPEHKELKAKAETEEKTLEIKDEVKTPTEEVKETIKKVETPKIKKSEAVVNAVGAPISTKDSMAVCKFIKNKKIGEAIRELESVVKGKKAIPAKGEIAHRRGKGMMSGIYATKTASHFILLLKSLAANANAHEIDDPVITEAFANFASRPYGRFGRTRKKRTHIKIVAREVKVKEKKK